VADAVAVVIDRAGGVEVADERMDSEPSTE